MNLSFLQVEDLMQVGESRRNSGSLNGGMGLGNDEALSQAVWVNKKGIIYGQADA